MITVALPSPVTYTQPSRGGKTYAPKTISALQATWIDDGQSVCASLQGFQKQMILWGPATSTTYTAIGNWTEAQAEAALLATLAATPAQTLEGLFL
jgi:hypothetical protein